MKTQTKTLDDGKVKVTVELLYDPTKTYPVSGTGNSYMVDGSGGFQLLQDVDVAGLKISVNLIKVIPKGERGK